MPEQKDEQNRKIAPEGQVETLVNAEHSPSIIEILQRERDAAAQTASRLDRVIAQMTDNKILTDFAGECWKAFIPILRQR